MLFRSCITDYINFCLENTVPTKTVWCFSKNKPWNNPDIKALPKEKNSAFRAGDKEELRAVQRKLRKSGRVKSATKRRWKNSCKKNNVSGV